MPHPPLSHIQPHTSQNTSPLAHTLQHRQPTTDNRQPTTPEHRRHTTSTWSRSGHQIRLTGPSTRDHAYTTTRSGPSRSPPAYAPTGAAPDPRTRTTS